VVLLGEVRKVTHVWAPRARGEGTLQG
jgi:hypothetical protein